jgi:hypothetical protein
MPAQTAGVASAPTAAGSTEATAARTRYTRPDEALDAVLKVQ